MAWAIPITVNDVHEVTTSFVAEDQLIQLRYDVLFGGTGGPITSDQFFTQHQTDWVANIVPRQGANSDHVQTKIQRISDVVLVGGKVRRIRGEMDKQVATVAMNGTALTPFLPLDVTVSVQLITSGTPRGTWGRKGFGTLPATMLSGDGETITALDYGLWDAAATAFFATTHAIGGTTMNYRCGILPSTFIANQPIPHGAMSGYFYPVSGVLVGKYVGSQKTRRINPQALKAH